LLNTDEGQDIALSYLQQRGFREETIKKISTGVLIPKQEIVLPKKH